MNLNHYETSVSASKNSPLFKVKTMLRCLRSLLGFPLIPANENWDEFIFKPSREYPRIILFLFLRIAPVIATWSITYNKLDEFKKLFSLSDMDVTVEGIVRSLSFMFNLIYFYNFKQNYKKIGKICKMMSDINHQQEYHHGFIDIYKTAKKKAECFVIISFMIGAVIIALEIISSYIGFVLEDPTIFPDHLKWIVAFTPPIEFLLGPISPMLCSGDFLVIYLINHLVKNLVCLKKVLKNRILDEKSCMPTNKRLTNKLIPTPNEEKMHKENGTTAEIELRSTPDDIDIILEIGINSCNVIRKFNKAFSSIIFCAYGGNLINATSTVYVAYHCLFLGKMTHARLIWGLKSTFFVGLCLARLFVLTISAHSLGQNIKDLKQTFDVYLTYTKHEQHSRNDFDDKQLQEKKIQLLKDALLDNDPPISPYGYFSLTGGTFLSTLATILTYLIVLIQFKLANISEEEST